MTMPTERPGIILSQAADLTDEEIDRICVGLVQSAAKVRHLQRQGFTVRRKADVRPLVSRANFEAVMGIAQSRPQSTAPHWSVPA